MEKIASIIIKYEINNSNKLTVDGFLTRSSADKLAIYYLQLLEAENKFVDDNSIDEAES